MPTTCTPRGHSRPWPAPSPTVRTYTGSPPGTRGAPAAGAFANRPDVHWLVGRYEVIDVDDRPIRRGVVRYKERQLRRYSYRALLRENFISQPAVFWRRAFGGEVGPLDESLHWTMDYDLWLRVGGRADPPFGRAPVAPLP